MPKKPATKKPSRLGKLKRKAQAYGKRRAPEPPYAGPFCLATANERGKPNPLTKCGTPIEKAPAVTLNPELMNPKPAICPRCAAA